MLRVNATEPSRTPRGTPSPLKLEPLRAGTPGGNPPRALHAQPTRPAWDSGLPRPAGGLVRRGVKEIEKVSHG
jgi:hypothetical protein